MQPTPVVEPIHAVVLTLTQCDADDLEHHRRQLPTGATRNSGVLVVPTTTPDAVVLRELRRSSLVERER